MNNKKQSYIYFALIALFVGSAAYFGFYLFHASPRWWQMYSNVYIVLLLLSTWYFFLLLFIGEQRRRPKGKYNLELISVVMPCYDEEPGLLKLAVKSIVEANGRKEIIIIDDGSSQETKKALKELKKHYGSQLNIYTFANNHGKRHGLHQAIKKMAKGEYIVTVDSDTVLDKNALVEIVKPLSDSRVGAVTGDINLLNEKKNWLTRMIGTYYWVGLNFYKKAQSTLGYVVCCSGCLAAYRADLVKGVIDEFLNQRFLGEPCTHSEDRHLTNLIIRNGYHVLYEEAAICYTQTPDTVISFLKQQQRWKRGYIRESIFTLTHAWHTRKLLFFEILLWDLTAPFFVFGLRLALIALIFSQPMLFVTMILPAWIVFMFVRYIFVLFYAKDKIPGMFSFMVFYELFLYWQNIYALFTVRNKSWVTR